MFFSAFQFGFDVGYQVIYPAEMPTDDPNGNLFKEYVPYGYELERYKRAERLEQLRIQEEHVKQDLYSQELKIEELELKRLREGLADKKLQVELLSLLREQHAMQQVLAMLEAERQRLLLEEEALMVILLTMEF